MSPRAPPPDSVVPAGLGRLDKLQWAPQSRTGESPAFSNKMLCGLVKIVRNLIPRQEGASRKNSQVLVSVQASSLGRREAGEGECRWGGSVANRIRCLEAGTSDFEVAANIRARRASMLSATKRICSSVSFARATLGTNLEDIVAKEKVHSCQRENVSIRRCFAIGELQ